MPPTEVGVDWQWWDRLVRAVLDHARDAETVDRLIFLVELREWLVRDVIA
jgi:hypothetical protein